MPTTTYAVTTPDIGLVTVLKDKLSKAKVGDSIGVRFDGERPTKGGRTFKAYTVVITSDNRIKE